MKVWKTSHTPPLDHLPRHTYYHLVHTLAAILPPPLIDTPEALLARDNAAIDAMAAMLPVNANEAALAAQCVALRAQANDVMRLLREHAGDIKLVTKLNSQCVAMARASQGAHGHLLRARAIRLKREADNATLTADEWMQHIVTCQMQQALAEGPVPATQTAAPSPPDPEPPAHQPAPAAPKPAAAPPQSRRMAPPPEPDDPPRDLPSEADYYAIVYPNRAREIRHHGGLPPNPSYGPPDDDLVHATVTGTSPTLRDLDAIGAAADHG